MTWWPPKDSADAKGTQSVDFDVFGSFIALGVGCVTFVGAYIYCTITYGFLFGFGLGWLPSFILAWMVMMAFWLLWYPPIVIGAIFIGLYFLFISLGYLDPSAWR